MHIVRNILLAVAACAIATSVAAAPAEPANGVEYLTLPVAQNTDAGQKVEVTEFFDYYCPHCNSFEPVLADWVRRQGTNIVFKRVHVGRDGNAMPQQRLYYTLESMGLVEQYHAKVFAAIHQDHMRLNRDEQVVEWAGQAGIDRAKFTDIYGSFGVQAKIRRAQAMMAAYKVDQWPLIAIDGRFMTSPAYASRDLTTAQSSAQQQQTALQVMDYLVTKVKAEKK